MAAKRIPWIRIKVEPKLLKELNQRSDFKGFRQVLTQLIVTIALGILSYNAFKTQPLYVSLPIFYIYATVYSFSYYTAALHELSHNTVFKTKWLNECFSIIFSFMSWGDYVFFNLSHTQHHAFTTHHDLDQEVVLPNQVTWFYVLQKFTIDFTRLYSDDILISVWSSFRRAMGIIKPGRETDLLGGSEKKTRKLIRWNRRLVLSHLALILFIVITKEWLLLLLITFAAFFAQWLNFLVSLTQHTGMQPDINDFRRNCRSVKLNPIYGFLYWQMHYHIEHHMYGGVPFYNLKKLHALLEDQLPERKGFSGALIEIYSAVKEQKSNPDYHVEVVIPD